MTKSINKIAILGTGTMGAGIAAHAASCGLDVLLLDLASDDGDRNAIAARAKANMTEGRAPMLDDAADADRIEVGNFSDDMGRLADCALIMEAIVEDLAIKRDFFNQIEAHRADGSIVTSNTSGIMLQKITEGMPARLQGEAPALATPLGTEPRALDVTDVLLTLRAAVGLVVFGVGEAS